jgi:major membrane immunogen (membrane-anchored lipoprotein)
MPKYILGVLVLALLVSCNASDSTNAPTIQEDPYFFDLAGFFNTEIKQLNSAQIQAHKTVKYNEKEDVLRSQKLDYEKELAVFVHSDINKLSWREKYSADTLKEGNEIRSITYKALDDQLKTQKIAISFDQNQVAQIAIKNHLKSIMANTWQELEYVPGKGYQVHGKQQMRLAGEDTMGIEVEFKE